MIDLLDTNILIDLIKYRRSQIAERVNALADDANLVTHTTPEFERVEGLQRVDWAG